MLSKGQSEQLQLLLRQSREELEGIVAKYRGLLTAVDELEMAIAEGVTGESLEGRLQAVPRAWEASRQAPAVRGARLTRATATDAAEWSGLEETRKLIDYINRLIRLSTSR
jgi:hypothetical protein